MGITASFYEDGVLIPSLNIQAESGDIISLPTRSKAGYAFTGWLIDNIGSPFKGQYTITTDTAFHAQYVEASVKFTVDFKGETDPLDNTTEDGKTFSPEESSRYYSKGDILSENIPDILEDFNISVEGFTDNVLFNPADNSVSGTGVFDIMMMTADKHLQAQYKAGRIRGEDYANAYIAIFSKVLEVALQLILQKDIQRQQAINYKAQRELVKNQILTEAASRATEKVKRKLYERQIKGFDDEFNNKFLKQILDSWSIFSTTSGEDSEYKPPVSVVVGDNVNNIIKHIAATLNYGFKGFKPDNPDSAETATEYTKSDGKNFWSPQV
jgi:hypothetical protein